jgi:DtxR family transcriptional regulator, Mn-dependent transcriptional regulator
MEEKDRVEELLETLWIRLVEERQDYCDSSLLKDDAVLTVLAKVRFITVEGNKLRLTESGRKEARNCVRRHRLAERLMVDVFDEKGSAIHASGCKFEHLLHKGLERNICTLLGHPQTCPHGKPIPPGSCCLDVSKERLKKIVVPLTELEVKEKAKVAYLRTEDREILQKIIAMGLLPKVDITLIQKFPSFVFQSGKSQFAVDSELASHIYVRRI